MDFTAFGKYLTQQRELRGLSREDVAQDTKIPPSLLLALESGQWERLPERVFVVNFLKAYAQSVGLEQDEVLLRFEEASGGGLPELAPTEPALAPPPARAPRALAAAVAACGLIAAVIWWLQRAG